MKHRTGGTLNKMCDFGTQGRRLYIVDAENLEGAGMMSLRGAARVRSAIEATLPPHLMDHVVVGTSHPGNAVTATTAWRQVRHVVRHGHDGADLALLEVLDEDIEQRYTEVVLASGDGIFTATVAALAGRGVPVTVISRRSGLSSQLRMAASHVVYLPEGEGPVAQRMAA
jgi:hypothetical protein